MQTLNSKLFLACDHAGFNCKQQLLAYLKLPEIALKKEIVDLGTHEGETSVPYPEYALKLCSHILKNPSSQGILICGSGIGMSIAANKFQGIRAALCLSTEDARLSREHNDANVICLGARSLSFENNKDILEVWLKTSFAEGRHKIRVEMMNKWGGPIPSI